MPGPSSICAVCSTIGCTRHQRGATYDLHRGSASKRGYDHQWNKVRNEHLRHEPWCRSCRAAGLRTEATEVDHIKPLRSGGARLDHANLQSLCHPCHTAKTRTDGQIESIVLK